MPNSLAYLALMLWPLVVAVLFQRLSPERALIWSILGAYLLLPPASHVYIDPPAVPPLDKMSLPALAAYLCATAMRGLRVPLMPENRGARILLLGFMLSPFGTALTNGEPIVLAQGRVLPGLSLYDGVSIAFGQAFVVLTFALARSLLTTAAALREFLVALMIAGLAYSLPMLVEVRLSPQLNTWIYGFFQHSFEQMMRQGGFRPIVFLAHGLWVAFFAMTAVLATVILAREAKGPARRQQLLLAGYLLVVLVLCKSIGSLIYALVFAPLLWWMPKRLLMRCALALAALTILYPMLRASGIFPAEQIVDFAAQYSADRAQSLGFRFENEALLLEHAYRKALFGWGGFDRNFLHNPITGEVFTVADGRWIITLGTMGWVGFLSEFGLLALPLWLLWRADRRGQPVTMATAGLMVIHSLNLVDLLPNATLTPLTWLAAGAMLGHAERLAKGEAVTDGETRIPQKVVESRTIL